jgi:hypothetical protein
MHPQFTCVVTSVHHTLHPPTSGSNDEVKDRSPRERRALGDGEPVIGTWDTNHFVRTWREFVRSAERVTLALDDQSRHSGAQQLGGSRLLRPPRQVQGERKGEHTDGASNACRPASDPGASTPPADDQWKSGKLTPAAQDRDDLLPGGVEDGRARRDLPARDPPGLFDADNSDALRRQPLREGDEIGRADASACPVAQDEHSLAVARSGMECRARLSNAGRDRQNRGHELQPPTEVCRVERIAMSSTAVFDLLPWWRRADQGCPPAR